MINARPTLDGNSQSAHQVILQHSPQPYEKRFDWSQKSLKMVFWKELINKQTIFRALDFLRSTALLRQINAQDLSWIHTIHISHNLPDKCAYVGRLQVSNEYLQDY